MKMSDCKSPAISTLTSYLSDILRHSPSGGRGDHREAIKNKEEQRLARVDSEKHYFLKHNSELKDVFTCGFSVKGNSELPSYRMLALRLLSLGNFFFVCSHVMLQVSFLILFSGYPRVIECVAPLPRLQEWKHFENAHYPNLCWHYDGCSRLRPHARVDCQTRKRLDALTTGGSHFPYFIT